jgi:hypothetical protein
MAQDTHIFAPVESFKVQAWFDVVSIPDKPFPYFYSLFNVFNYSKNEAELIIGMQLLDQAGKVLLEATDKALFKPTQKTEGSYETYFSVNAKPVSAEIANQTKYLRVVFRR